MSSSDKIFRPFADDPDAENSADATSIATRNLLDDIYVPAEDNAQFRNYWRAVRKYLWLILAVLSLVTVLMTIYMARKPDIYEAYAQVQIDVESNPSFGTSKSGSILVSGGSDPAYFNTQLRVLTSSGLLGRVVETLDLENNKAFRQRGQQDATIWQSVMRMVGVGQNTKTPNRAESPDNELLTVSVAPATSRSDLEEAERVAPYVEAIRRNLKVEPYKEARAPSKDTRLIELRYQHANPLIAAKIVNTILETFTLSNLEKKTETNTSAGEFLEKRIAELQSQIRSGEERLANYAANNEILTLDPNQNTVVERLNAINRQLLDAENQRKEAQAAYQARLTPGAVEAQADSTDRLTGDAESKLAVLQQRREELLVEDTEESPVVRAIDRQIALLQTQITSTRKRAISNVVTNLDTRYREAFTREQSLRSAFDQQRNETLAQNKAAINYRIIQQEVETQKGLLNGLLQRSKENDIMLASLAGTPNNIHVLDYALIPKRPIGPQRWLSVGLVSGVALALSIGLAIFLGYLDDSVHSSDEVERMLHLPALAVVPTVGGSSQRRLLSGIGIPLRIRQRKGLTPLVNDDVRSPLAEAYRRLRTSILLSTAGQPPKTLLVTSSLPDEGKTTTAANIALTLAGSGDKVLIVDADMHRPSLQSVFNTDNYVGLSSCLVKQLDEAELFASIKQYEDTTLHVLTAGPIPPNPAELLGSPQMHELVAKLEATFDYIVIDSPPITYFTDGVLLTAVVDGVLLVVNSGTTSRAVVQRSRKVLRDVNARVFGVVLNNVDLKPQDYSY